MKKKVLKKEYVPIIYVIFIGLLFSFFTLFFVSNLVKNGNQEFINEERTLYPIWAFFSILFLTGLLAVYLKSVINKSIDVKKQVSYLSTEVDERNKEKNELKEYRSYLENMVKSRGAELELSEKNLHTISWKILNSQEEERKRISRELHDGVGQNLSSLKLSLQMIQQKVNNGEPVNAKIIMNAINSISLSIEELRNTAMALRPAFFEDMEFAEILIWYGNKIEDLSGININVDIASSVNISSKVKDHLFRIYQESLNNIQKHAGASSVWVTMENLNDLVILNIKDNGMGFKYKKVSIGDKQSNVLFEGLGLSTMKERAELLGGVFEIRSRIGMGTTVCVEIPLKMVNI